MTTNEIPFSLDDLSVADLLQNYELKNTRRRFTKIGGHFIEISERVGVYRYHTYTDELNLEYEAAEFGEVELIPKAEGKFRVQRVLILYSRVMEGRECPQSQPG